MNPIYVSPQRARPKPHYELHFSGRVEFWTLDGEKLGENPIIDTVEWNERDTRTGWHPPSFTQDGYTWQDSHGNRFDITLE